MTIKNPVREGELFIVNQSALYLNYPKIDIPKGSAVLFLETQTYEEALSEHDTTWESIDKSSRSGPKDMVMWKMLYKEHLFWMDESDAAEFLSRHKK